MKCIVCGRKEGDTYTSYCQEYEVFISEFKLPHGSVPLCNNKKCKQIFTTTIWDKSYPVVWLADDDLVDGEHMTEEEFEKLSVDELIELADDTAELLWQGDFSEEFHNIIEQTFEQKEKERVKDTPRKGLPLLIGALKYNRNKVLLEQRLKGEEE